MNKIKWIFLLALAANAYAGGTRAGNGGGAWVCREPENTLRWVKLVDLFEAQSEFGLNPAQLPGSYTDIVDAMQVRLFKADESLFTATSRYFDHLSYLKNNPPSVQYTQDTLELIGDSLYRLKPNISQCAGGILVTDPQSGENMIPYEQVVNYKNDGNVLIQIDLWNKLSETEKAALVFHEAIYAYFRDLEGDTDSVKTRRIVGLIFSTLSSEDLTKALTDMGVVQKPTPINLSTLSFADADSLFQNGILPSDLSALSGTWNDVLHLTNPEFRAFFNGTYFNVTDQSALNGLRNSDGSIAGIQLETIKDASNAPKLALRRLNFMNEGIDAQNFPLQVSHAALNYLYAAISYYQEQVQCRVVGVGAQTLLCQYVYQLTSSNPGWTSTAPVSGRVITYEGFQYVSRQILAPEVDHILRDQAARDLYSELRAGGLVGDDNTIGWDQRAGTAVMCDPKAPMCSMYDFRGQKMTEIHDKPALALIGAALLQGVPEGNNGSLLLEKALCDFSSSDSSSDLCYLVEYPKVVVPAQK